MNCDCGDCIPRETLCIGGGNSKRFLFSVLDQDGDEFDISAATQISFIVSDGVWVSGNLTAGGQVRIQKLLTSGGVAIAGTGYQFIVDILPTDVELLQSDNNYWDATVTTAAGNVYTVKAGIFRVTQTSAGD